MGYEYIDEDKQTDNSTVFNNHSSRISNQRSIVSREIVKREKRKIFQKKEPLIIKLAS